MNVSKAIGVVLKQARIKAGMTQVDLAYKAGFDRTYISMLERGVRQPTLSTIFDLCDTLGVNPVEFIKRVHRKL